MLFENHSSRGGRRVPEGRRVVRADRVGCLHDVAPAERAGPPAELCRRQGIAHKITIYNCFRR